MEAPALPLIALGLLFLAGLGADWIGRRTWLPRVTLLLGCGLVVGKAGFDLLPERVTQLYPTVSVIALSAVAFLLGSALSLETLRTHGKAIIMLSLSVVIVTLAVVSAGLWLIGVPLALALILGAMATATDPAAIYDVIDQSGRASGFTDRLKGIVAIDDGWGLIVFSLALVLSQFIEQGDAGGSALLHSLQEIGGSVALGLAIGLPAAYLTGRMSEGEPLRIEGLGLIFLTAGLSIWLNLSYLIAGMTVGAVIVNVATHHTKAFHEIEHFEWPFMIIFFVLAGASLDAWALLGVGGVGVAYAGLRVLGRIAGGWAGGHLSGVPRRERPWYGPALLPQAGVAIGMALIASDKMPDQADTIMALAVGTTVAFELLGPVVAAVAISRAIGPRAR
ncbi:Kef-type K+ transport system, membrane component KefB [Salinihabitans flavidus]|uniref:Kef-type K+ transport system, membrane component KefB n=1 Tax=Salinihabitans flavidus TaxID=569882 RepID=A0A1H8NIW0_9RHOB|nr:cation:proton antiporter [Salinihabitans flavidus]SEO29492.1 Kef-type K+ transport system, membrane component KefB [Salinihabitans flavidus]